MVVSKQQKGSKDGSHFDKDMCLNASGEFDKSWAHSEKRIQIWEKMQ
jgi:hypothetical protein